MEQKKKKKERKKERKQGTEKIREKKIILNRDWPSACNNK